MVDVIAIRHILAINANLLLVQCLATITDRATILLACAPAIKIISAIRAASYAILIQHAQDAEHVPRKAHASVVLHITDPIAKYSAILY